MEQIAAATAAAHSAQTSTNKKQTLNRSFNAAAGAARNWLAAKQAQGQTHGKKSSVDNTQVATGVHIRNGQFHDGEESGEAALSAQARVQSHTEPMGRGQPLPPPGTPLPRPPSGKAKTWGVPVQAASALANLAKRKAVSGPGGSAGTEEKGAEGAGTSQSSSSSSVHQVRHDDDECQTSSGSTQGGGVGRRKSSSSMSQHAPALPKRRQRQSSATTGHGGYEDGYEDGRGEEVFVVEAPLVETSAPASPAAGVDGGHGRFPFA